MKIFVTGASGWIGSAVVPELIEAGHTVVGLARSDASAEAITAAGAEVARGGLDDLDVLRKTADSADAVIHLAFVHDFANFGESIRLDRAAIEAFGEVLAGSDRAFTIASGVAGLMTGRPVAETDRPSPEPVEGEIGRVASARTTLALADRGVRSSIVRLAPTVHGRGDHGFVATQIGIARAKAASGYVGDGTNRWAAVHVSDAARLFRLAIEQAPAGSILHGVAEEGISEKQIAEVIARHLDVPAVSVAPTDVVEHFGWLGPFLAADLTATNAVTQDLLDWHPTGPTLLEDLEAGHYFS